MQIEEESKERRRERAGKGGRRRRRDDRISSSYLPKNCSLPDIQHDLHHEACSSLESQSTDQFKAARGFAAAIQGHAQCKYWKSRKSDPEDANIQE